jgi:hypothetical protein
MLAPPSFGGACFCRLRYLVSIIARRPPRESGRQWVALCRASGPRGVRGNGHTIEVPDELLLIFSTVNPVLPLGRMKTKRAARESRPVPSDRVHPDLHCDSCRNSDYSRRPSSLCSVISGARRLGGDVANSPPLRLHPDNSSDMPRRISQPRGC